MIIIQHVDGMMENYNSTITCQLIYYCTLTKIDLNSLIMRLFDAIHHSPNVLKAYLNYRKFSKANKNIYYQSSIKASLYNIFVEAQHMPWN